MPTPGHEQLAPHPRARPARRALAAGATRTEGGPMTYRSPAPEGSQPGQLLLRTAGACSFDPGHLLEIFARQRQRFVAVLRQYGPADWAASTRCTDWSAHDVVRHLCDGTTRLAAAGPDDRTYDLTAGYDPRITPRKWLAASASEPPGATLSRFLATTDQLLALARDRLARSPSFTIPLPYGPADWTVLLLHTFWDSWLHERDVLLAGGREHPTDGDATLYATAYGLFIAAAVASMFGDQIQQELTLGGDGGGIFDLDSRGAITLTATRATTAGLPAAEITDALAGRAPAAAVLGDLPASSRAALSRMADFFSTPVQQSLA
jgi:uncharacterized protein (TIGR03083 family)